MQTKKKQSYEELWPLTGGRFAQLPRVLLKNHHRITVKVKKASAKNKQRSLNPTEVLLLVHLIDFYWANGKPPRPTVATLSRLMARKERAVREAIGVLRDAKLIETEAFIEGGPNRYKLDKLLERLQQFHAEEEAKKPVPVPAAEQAPSVAEQATGQEAA